MLASAAAALVLLIGFVVFFVLNPNQWTDTVAALANNFNGQNKQTANTPLSLIPKDKMASGIDASKNPRNPAIKQTASARLQGVDNYAEAFRASILSSDYLEVAAAKRLHVFCTVYSPHVNVSFDQWYVESNVPLDKVGVGAPPSIASALESERKKFAKNVSDRCSGFIDGSMSRDEALRLSLQGFKNHPQFSEMNRARDLFLSGGSPTSSLNTSSPLFGSNEPLAYDFLLRYAKSELELPLTNNIRVNNLYREYVGATALCLNNIDCSPTSITFAENCINLGACSGASAEDALREALRGHNVNTENLDPMGYALSQWLAGKGTWAQLMGPFKKKA